MTGSDPTPTWFITGCSSGLGRELALTVLERGWNAVVTARDVAALDDIVEAYPQSTFAVAVDVTDAGNAAAAVAAASDRFGAIDVLVNNAGYGYRGAVEEGDPADVDQLFATNVFGPISLIKAVLPDMRARRSGAIVSVSSVAGVRASPGSGYYSASKFALEAVSDALNKEVGPLGITVMVVEPGPFRTEFAGRSLQQSATIIADYAQTAGARRKERDTSHGNQPGDPKRAAQAIITALGSAHPPFRLVLGRVGLRAVRTELEARLEELAAWEETTVSADFPA